MSSYMLRKANFFFFFLRKLNWESVNSRKEVGQIPVHLSTQRLHPLLRNFSTLTCSVRVNDCCILHSVVFLWLCMTMLAPGEGLVLRPYNFTWCKDQENSFRMHDCVVIVVNTPASLWSSPIYERSVIRYSRNCNCICATDNTSFLLERKEKLLA